MKYIKFTVKPLVGKEAVVVLKYYNDDLRPPLDYTWKTPRETITSTVGTHREYRNYVRRGLTGYEALVEVLR